MLFIPSFLAQGKQDLTVYFPTHFTTVIRSGENEAFIVCFPECVNAMKTRALHEHYTDKHVVFLSVFRCFLLHSNMVFCKCLSNLGWVSQNLPTPFYGAYALEEFKFH